MTDALLSQTADGGEITLEAGQLVMDDGAYNAAYLSLFGGNEDDTGDDADKPKEWWANKNETDATKKYRSRTQALLRSIAATSGNLELVKEANLQDLAWMLDTKFASFVDSQVTIPALNWIDIQLTIVVQDKTFTPSFARKVGIS